MLDKVIEVVVAYVSPFLSVGTLITVIGWIVSSVRHNKRLRLNSGLTGGVSDKTVADLKVRLADLESKLEQSEAARKEDNKAAADILNHSTALLNTILDVQNLAYAESNLSGDTRTNIKNIITTAQNSSSIREDLAERVNQIEERNKERAEQQAKDLEELKKELAGKVKSKKVIG